MASREFFECSVCRALFRAKPELTAHLKASPVCKTVPKKRDPHAFTRESTGTHSISSAHYSKTVPDTIVSSRHSSSSKTSSSLADGTLLAAMEAGMKKIAVKPKRKSGLETSILSTIADGDEELITVYSRLPLDPVTGERRLNEEIVSSVTTKAKISVAQVAAFISRSQRVTICFLLDTTGSMASYISGVKEQIVEIVQQVETSGCGIEGLAFVGYKDWCDGENHFEVLPFTKSITEFKAFVASVRATGGGDFPEDVLGGLHKAISLSWPERSGTRIIFHLGDAPPHGKNVFHDGRRSDSYENGHPRDLPLVELFKEMLRKELMYYFGRINNECDKMISVFEQHYGKKIEPMDSTKVTTICSAVTESVMRSVSVTYRTKIPSTVCSRDLRKFTLDEKEPDWSLLPRYDGTILTFDLPDSIKDITSFAKLEDSIKKCRLQIAQNPFAKGSVRLAYYGRIFYVTKDESCPKSLTSEIVDDVVFKEMITLPKIVDFDRQRYMADLEVQTVAAKLAFEFNAKLFRTSLNLNIKLKFLMAKVVRIFMGGDSTPRFLVYEKRFRGDSPVLIKYTNNLNFVLNPEALDENERRRLELAVAFSHFTYDITDGYLLVCDLQGVCVIDLKGKETLLLTDPAIHCAKHLRFGKTNLSNLGIEKFFKKHVCNKYCHALGLKMPASE